MEEMHRDRQRKTGKRVFGKLKVGGEYVQIGRET